MLSRGPDSEGLAIYLKGTSSSGLRHLLVYPGYIFSFLTVLITNTDIYLGFGPFNKLSPSPSFVPVTQKGQVGVLTLEATLSDRSAPLLQAWEKAFGVFLVPKGLTSPVQPP